METEEACGCGEARGLERVRYFPRQLLTADDMRAEQEHARERQRRFNRFVIGWGVVCGLEVQADPDNPEGVCVCPGYALSPWGDEIYVPEPKCVPFSRRVADPSPPCKPVPAAPTKNVYVVIKYQECLARPVRTSPAGCGCDDTACEYSRLRDGYQIDFLRSLPASHVPSPAPVPSVCDLVTTQTLIPCPPCPKDSWVVLATLRFPSPPPSPPAPAFTIDNRTDRRILVSAAMVQAQLLQFCRDRL
jgi:hypothetical protein